MYSNLLDFHDAEEKTANTAAAPSYETVLIQASRECPKDVLFESNHKGEFRPRQTSRDSNCIVYYFAVRYANYSYSGDNVHYMSYGPNPIFRGGEIIGYDHSKYTCWAS